jgi:hypothetical protein
MSRSDQQMAEPGGTRELRRLVAMCSHLSALATQQADTDTIVRCLAQSCGSCVALLDPQLEVLAVAGSIGSDDIVGAIRDRVGTEELRRMLTAADSNRRALTSPRRGGPGSAVVVAPVSVGDDIAGYLVTIGEGDRALVEDMLLLASEHAAMVCGILLGRDLIVAAAAGRIRRELVEGLLLARGNDDGEAVRWAQHLGFDDSVEHTVVAFALPAVVGAADLSIVERQLERLARDAIVSGRADEVVAVVPALAPGRNSVQRAQDLAASAIAALSTGHLRIDGVGIGNPCRSPADIARSYAEARRALVATVRMGRPGAIAVFADLGIHRLLARFPDVAELRSFAEEVIGGLIDEDRSSGTEYLTTLSVYFEESNSPARAGKRLFVHPNTITYRIRRIEEITGLSLATHQDRLMAEVAIKILDGLRSQQ